MRHIKEYGLFESLPQQSTVNQLKKLRKIMKGIDVGDKISDMNREGENIMWIRNPVDSGIESYQDYQKKGKKFNKNWNLKHLKPFSDED